MSRHPKACIYYRDYGRCKFNPCAFLHLENENSILEDLRKEREVLNAKIAEVDSALEVSKVREIELVGFVDKLKLTETKLDDMEKKVDMVETKISEN